METMGQRISKCISVSGLTKTAFAEKLKVSQSFVSRLASGEKMPSERTISDICEKFDISEEWLKTGNGEMRTQHNKDKDEEFDRICTEIQLSDDQFIKEIMRKYWNLDENGKKIIRKMLSGLSEK